MKHSEYVEAIKSSSVLLLKQAISGVIIGWLPFLATGPLNLILIKIVTKLAEALAERVEMSIFFKYIDLRVDTQAKDFEAAMLANKIAQTSGLDQEKKDAEEKLISALHDLASFKS